jgi:hypothetical protein
MSSCKIGYFVDNLSSTSINRRLANALVRLAPPELAMAEIGIKDLPLYSQDYDADYPPVARAFKQAIAQVDGVLLEKKRPCGARPSERLWWRGGGSLRLTHNVSTGLV